MLYLTENKFIEVDLTHWSILDVLDWKKPRYRVYACNQNTRIRSVTIVNKPLFNFVNYYFRYENSALV
ncbi:hypothetical protein K8089_07530 [Aequorivita sp. F47161]|uniref:Uncharacterized protein n=1 Tax=Aequorivita vitellina TaxID=2874475 RepID=A0A9X1QUA0_9FLAO|nr:hypothetical protein [Aequorivita vitellina]MCG2418870.1 hypothetical protein [Aequorivita vitellina]